MGPEAVRAAGGAGDADLDVPDTGPAEPQGVGFLQVDVVFAAETVFINKFPHLAAQGIQQRIGDVGIGFEAALADVGADGGVDVVRIAAVFPDHGFHGLLDNAGGGAAPAGMDRAHSPGDGIVEEDGGAVGGEDHQTHAGLIGNQGITLGIFMMVQTDVVGTAHPADDVGMGLMAQHQILRRKADALAQDPVVFHHVGILIAPVHGDVHAPPDAGADTGQPGGKAVGHLDAVGLQIFHSAVAFVFDRHSISPCEKEFKL